MSTYEEGIRALIGGGEPLAGRLRAAFEDAFGSDLSALRIHRGAQADRVARPVGAEAVTVGADIFFAEGSFAPETSAGLELLAHEIVHAVDQGGARRPRTAGMTVSQPEDGCEARARRLAAAFVGGRPCPPAGGARVRALAPQEQLVVQRHASFEHRLLGDAPPTDLEIITLKKPDRQKKLQDLQGFLRMWQEDPDSVTREKVTAKYPTIRTLKLSGSGLLVTYGELNTLADYLADPAALDSLPKTILEPILQYVRQESYYWVGKLLGSPPSSSSGAFKNALVMNTNWAFLDLLLETRAADDLTRLLGPQGTNHYSAIVGRNACHFAPYSWYRWERYHLIARDYATQAFFATGSAKTRLEYLAWINHGYADHFLQDSFAAGHLVNKTLIMQWFVEWAATIAGRAMPVADWPMVKTMTAGSQSGLAARGLYQGFLDASKRGVVRDPQTAEENWSLDRRIRVAGVQKAGFRSEVDAYKHYLTFMNNAGVQLTSGLLHDQLNTDGLYVASEDHPAPFQVYGDCTLMDGGDGVRIAAETAQLSQASITELLATGKSAITVAQIFHRFPTKVRDAGTAVVSLEQWNNAQRQRAEGLFANPKIAGLRVAVPRIGKISVDDTGGWTWRTLSGQKAVDIAVGGDGSVWITAPPASGGTGNIIKKLQGDTWTVIGGSADRIAVDGTGVAWVVNSLGRIYRWDGGKWQEVTLEGIAGGTDGSGAQVIGASDIGAGSDGSVWITGRTELPSGHPLYRWNGVKWEPVQGAGVAISVAPNGLPWVLADKGGISRRTTGGSGSGAGWLPVDGSAADVAVSTGVVPIAWVVGGTPQSAKDADVYVATDAGWDKIPAAARRIAVGPDGSPWVVAANGDIRHLVPATESRVVFSTRDAGKTKGTAVAAQGALFPGDTVEINGTTDLSKIIVGNSEACAYSIKMEITSAYYDFVVEVDSQGPKGIFAGNMYLWFVDETDDTYMLSIVRSDRDRHVVRFDSDRPGIKEIRWSDSLL